MCFSSEGGVGRVVCVVWREQSIWCGESSEGGVGLVVWVACGE